MDTVYTMPEFEQAIGEIYWQQKQFSMNTGGGPDPDSWRGFGATEQYWNIPTENGWTIWYGDNGGDIKSATAPDGTEYIRTRRIDTQTFPDPDETVTPQLVMRPDVPRITTLVVKYQTGYYAGCASKPYDIFSDEEAKVAVDFLTAAGMTYRFE